MTDTKHTPDHLWAWPDRLYGWTHGHCSDALSQPDGAEYMLAKPYDDLLEALIRLERICRNGQPDKIADGYQIARAAIAKAREPQT